MNPKTENPTIRSKCVKSPKKSHNNHKQLEEIIATNLTNEIMDQFEISTKQRKHLINFATNYGSETKLKQCKEELIELYALIPRKNTAHENLYELALKCPIIPMSRFLEHDIRSKIQAGKELEKKCSNIIDDIIKEAKEIYLKITHMISINLKVKSIDFEQENYRCVIKPFKYAGRTERYQIFLSNRQKLQKIWRLHYPLIKTILWKCLTLIPNKLFDIGLSLKGNVYTLQELSDKFEKFLDSAIMDLERFYHRVVSLIEKDKTRFPNKTTLRNYLRTCTCILGVQIGRILMDTMIHIVNVTQSEDLVPMLKLTISLDNGLQLKPSLAEVIGVYSQFLQNLVSLGQCFCILETYRLNDIADCYIPLYVSDDFLDDCIKQTSKNIQTFYEPILNYVQELDVEFFEIYGDIREREQSLISNDNTLFTFDFDYDQILLYQTYLMKTNSILSTKHFSIGQLISSEYVQLLKDSLMESIRKVFIRLCDEHLNDNSIICNFFENIKINALEIPENTKELMDQGKYMIWVKTVHLHELRERIELMLINLVKLINCGDIAEDHMIMNSVTVNWFKKIEPILEQNSIMYEQIKYDIEEKLQRTIQEVNVSLKSLLPFMILFDLMDEFDNCRDYFNQIKTYMVTLKDIKLKILWINQEEGWLGFALSNFKLYHDITEHVYPFLHLIKLCLNLKRKINVWYDGQFEFLNSTEIEDIVEDFLKTFIKLQKTYRNKLRQQQRDDILKFNGIIDDPEIYNWPTPLKLITKAIQLIKDFRPSMVMIRIMCNDALMKRHWKEMSGIAGFDLTPNAGTSLRKLMNLGLDDDIEKYDVVSSAATKERELLRHLNKMQNEWIDICFKTGQYKDTGISILTQLDDVQVVLDDHLLKTLTMRGSVFVKPYENEVKLFYEKLVRMNNTIDEWGKVQSQWLYLLPIFSSKDIIAQMPEEGMLFREINDTYKRYMDIVNRDSRVTETAGMIGVYEAMVHCIELLEQINDGVTAYLEKKRLYFPRFFFLSNDEMLEILSETKNPLRVQPHLKKCFEAISSLLFNKELEILSIFSQENEKINVLEIIKTKECGGSVEKWLVLVEKQMVMSIRNEILLSFQNYILISRNDWVQQWPGQIVLVVSQIYWTIQVHKALNRNDGMTIEKYNNELNQQLKDIVSLIRSPKLTNLSRITIKALIVIDVHAKDIVNELLLKKVRNDKEFKWLSQMRYYLEDDQCLVRLINATVKYAYEYLGNTDRLVITPLTDRCYRTLIGAYHLHLNGAPEGPAGTGKTETTKDLAKALAVQCVVFNCSDGLDYKAMGKFFKGLASCGAWVCFDEFNRIDIEVLSVVAQQILSIVLAVRGNFEKLNFEGTELTLNPTCYVCITMNPGYAGRSELPDNLKVLFRTVAMMVPDYAMIGEISLYSYGFIDARNLSVKIVTVYRLCSEQLSSQNHYDYGMRAVKSVLSAAGNNKRNYPNEEENILLLRAILDVNLPKFLSHDIPLFEGIISDLFPGVSLPKVDYQEFINIMKKCSIKYNLQPKETFLQKIIQTYEMMIVRHGFMIVGEPFAGKTSTLTILAESLGYLKNENKVYCQILNPKSITMGQLYGQFDPISYEWTDGVVATCFRNYANNPSPDRKWIVFDGPVDAVWIENMNSVLDDNKKLCLMSGEVMSMTNSMSLIFEVMDLEQASPATVSRCGMIYMEPITLGWYPLVQSWLVNCNPIWCQGNEDKILDFFQWLVPPSLDFLHKNCLQYCNVGDISLVKNMMQLVEMFFNEAYSVEGAVGKKEDEVKNSTIWQQAVFIQAGIWGLGSILDKETRIKFDEFYKNLWLDLNPNYPYPQSMEKLEVSIPNDGLLFDHIYHFRLKGNWKYWPDIVKTERLDECKNILQALIPTTDTLKYITILKMHIKYKKQFLLVGPTGTGKSFYIQDLLMNQLDKDKYEPSFITFTVQITANQTQDLIISKLNKLKRDNYGPTKGMISILFIDDINMPVKEVYGAQPPIELLRQYFDHKNWYDLKNTNPIYLNDVIFIGAMGLVGGSRQEIYQRFLRHFSLFSINEFSEETMSKIYSNILLLGWKNNGFPSDIIMVVHQIVDASLNIYRQSVINLRPTPSKSHYVFNLRDFSRLILGCAMLRKESVNDKLIFIKIWVHEVLRVFFDRLIQTNDKIWLFNAIKTAVRSHFKEPFEHTFNNLLKENDTELNYDSMKNLLFGTYFDQDSNEDERRYEEILNIETFHNLSKTCLDDYNSSHKNKMDIVLFDYALEHLSKICRILSMSSGSGLLVGISGSGRQSLTKLAGEIYNQTLFQSEITKNYGLNEWRDDIKKILKESGGKGKHCIFLISENQIKDEHFLQDVECLLNSGEVPNMYQMDEKQEILDMVRLAAQGGNRNLDLSALNVFFFFTKRCKERLHIILCFSPIGSTFRNRLRLYPSLINCCTIDWFDDWPENGLEEVAENWMEDVNLDKTIKNSSVIACKYFHVKAREASTEFYKQLNRKIYITSASYLELIKSFTILTNTKQNEIIKIKKRYLGGLEKLLFAAKQISEMQNYLGELKPKLAIMTEQAVKMRTEIEKETIQVELTSELVKKDEKIANKQAAESQKLKTECEAELSDAIPILEEALSALDTLKPNDITLVKSMKNPPATVKLVMAAVCIMKDYKPDRIADPSSGKMVLDYWGPSKRMLGDMNFLQSLKDYDKDNIKPEIMLKIRKEYLANKDFKPNIVAKASSAAEGLCKWIIALDKYDDVIKIVAPKKAKLEAAERKYNATMALLNEKKQEVAQLEAKLAILNEQLAEAIRKQNELEADVELCNNKLIRAQKLIGGLGGEKTRWTLVAQTLQQQYDGLAGDILISCGIIAYLSSLNAYYRQLIINDWHDYVKKLNIPTADNFDFIQILGSDVKIQNWYISTLPRDNFSTENGIIQENSRRWSLFIDPQLQASNWIKKMEKQNGLEIVKFSHGDYMKKMENCVKAGLPILIESIEENVEAPLDPLLYKQTFKQAGIEVISLGENVIEYNKNFRLYMTSKLRNPHYLPEIFNKVTIINFALTLDGLQDQLLGIVVAVEKPDLQRLKEDLVVEKAQNKSALEKVEAMILKTLSETKGDILENEAAIQILDESKIISADIRKKQEKSVEVEKTIEEFRKEYVNVAKHSAVLYYCISDLANVDPMYQYSLEWFINLYISSIQKAEKFREINKRCFSLIKAFTYDLYTNITRSLFEKDKLLFSFILCSKIQIFQKKMDENEFLFLLTGGTNVENFEKNPCDWLPNESWDILCRLHNLQVFKDFLESFRKNLNDWKKIYDVQEPENSSLPQPWNNNLSSFHKLILLRILRPDKFLIAARNFVAKEMDEKFITPPQFNIAVSYNDSYCLCPLIFILSPGVDPMAALVKFAEEKKFIDRFHSISLGQGQGPIAKHLIEQGQMDGLWICLQNCHLSTSWMPELEKIFENLDFDNTHDSFRLWLTSYPCDKFPISILQRGVKMTNEPPTGLRENLLKSYTNDPVKNPEFYSGCPSKDEMFAKLLYGLAFFHAVVQERRTFGPLGWNIPYGFNESDFDISVQQLQMFIKESENPYDALTYLIGECNYGGRVTDDWDRRLIITILDDFLNEQMTIKTHYLFIDVDDCYGLPIKYDYQSFINHIKSLSQTHSPEVFGLHSNAGITRDLQDSNLLINSILKAYGEVASSGGISEGDKLLLNLCSDILSKLPKRFDIEIVKIRFPVEYTESMNTVLVQEMDRFNKLLHVIHSSLVNMEKAVQGLVVMSPDLESLSSSLLLSKIPANWLNVSYPSLKNLPNYVSDFIKRMEFLYDWFNDGKPSCYWVSGFFFTQAFLTGVKQNYARKYTIPIDQLTFDFDVLKVDRLKDYPVDGAYIYGLFTDGARWDRTKGQLDELLPKILYDIMPLILLKPIIMSDYKEGKRYKCPVYKTSTRRGVLSTTGHSTNYVLPVLLATKQKTAHWIKRSVALLCQLN